MRSREDGDEIPPDVARAVHGLAAEEEKPARRQRGDRDLIAGAENQKPAAFEAVAGDLDGALRDINAAFLMLRGQWHFGAGL